jgi:hypothetical protein
MSREWDSVSRIAKGFSNGMAAAVPPPLLNPANGFQRHFKNVMQLSRGCGVFEYNERI